MKDLAHIKVLVAAADSEDGRLVVELLREDFHKVESTSDPDTTVSDFEAFQPEILVLAFRTLAESERFYLGLYRLSSTVHAVAHRTIVFCQRGDAFRAYELCRKGHFDDYVVFWPSNYDPYRVRMAVLLAGRELHAADRSGPSPMQFAAQARRVAALASTLQQQLEQGDARMGDVDDSLRLMEPDMAASVSRILHPVRDWVGSFRCDIAPQLESVRSLTDLAAQVRPCVLVVDDDEFQHRLLREMLSEAPVDLTFALNSTGAVAALRTRQPDLILMDFHLPDASGVEITRRLKSSPQTAHIPVILITGTSTKEVAIESREAGAVDFMVKPFGRERLLAGLKRHLYGAAVQT